jgi:N-acetylglucosaminyldiphosphoundecaprenol N-acetyl-beta-D-mannosaminyltransferase
MRPVTLHGVPFAAQTLPEAIDAMLGAATERRRLRAHFCNVHTLVESQADAALRGVYLSADMVTMDGMPIVWLARVRGHREAERVTGPDVMAAICDRGRALGLRHYFVGGQPGVPEALRDRLSAHYPGLQVVGLESPPFRQLTPAEDQALVDRINAAKPDVVWIGLGAPKQEYWAVEHAGRLEASLLLPVGAAFDFHSGRIRRAPTWMRHAGLEWLFRLAADPRRLWRRYAVTNTRFALMLLDDVVRGRGRSGTTGS